ncbi:uncharacterized protein LOC113312772 [Papaver somniferum]|uniref:uncharacterized protein LOC113312772 n=1 Tax=Papaver somniferum TaxID=3469 RepID=UPI000E705AA7|nr:uncharacterized protein LOC113312772 [Papaver somniferum]
MLNGGPIGYFGVGRGVKQGDPLSPILYVLVADSLSRKLSQLIQERKIHPMVIRKGIFPSHLFFADDIFIFCNGCKQTLVNLKHLRYEYQSASGQIVSAAKSKKFIDGTSDIRQTQITEYMDMKLFVFLDKYLGVLLFQGKVKTEHLWSFVEILQKRLATWIGKLLNFQARLTLIKFVLSSIPLYNMSIYRWPKKIILACERILRNFLWSGNADEKKYITIAWDKVCVPLEEGGLGIRKFEDINKALLMKLLWRILKSNEDWANFFLAKYKDKNGLWISYYKQSSICPGIKWVLQDFEENTRWLVGNGEDISLWNDSWILDASISKYFPRNEYIQQNINMKVKQLIVNNSWNIPEEMLTFFSTDDLPLLSSTSDKLVWTATQDGEFSVSSAINIIKKKRPKLKWYKKIWNSCVHPSTSSNIWKITMGAGNTDENDTKRGMVIASRCFLCHKNQDTMSHILWDCNYGQILWNWIGNIFAFKNSKSFDDVINLCKHKSSVVQELWYIAAFNIMVDIWFTRNIVFFDNILPDSEKTKIKISRMVHDCENRLKGFMHNTSYDLQILKYFDIGCRKVKTTKAIKCFFLLPEPENLLFCCDGASRGNPGNAGYGFIVKDNSGSFITAESGGLGISTNFIAKIMGALCAMEWVVLNQKEKIIINSDSTAAISAFMKNKLSWFVWNRWKFVSAKLKHIHFNHVYREVNFSAAFLLKKVFIFQRDR